jgi:predicted butyrate kinase (DUF1464 family)
VPRVIGIDPGTVSIDVCGLDNGRVFVDRTFPTADAVADPDSFVAFLKEAGPLDLVAGPSGYGLPITPARDVTDNDLRLAYLAAAGETGGIGGLRQLMRALGASSLPVVFTPGVIHLPSVPEHRKVNRVDMGTADKVCATALAVQEQAVRLRCAPRHTSFIMVELGGAFTAAIAVEGGAIVDGIGGSSGPLGVRAAGALDGEVAYLAVTIGKEIVFHGGAATIAGMPDADAETIAASDDPRARVAWAAFLESLVKSVAALRVSAPHINEVVLSGRLARVPAIRDEIAHRLSRVVDTSIEVLVGFAPVAKQAAQGAAIIADGLAGGASRPLVETMRIAEASGTVLDHLYVIDSAAARARLRSTL